MRAASDPPREAPTECLPAKFGRHQLASASSSSCISRKKMTRAESPPIRGEKTAGGWIPRAELQSSRAAGKKKKMGLIYMPLSGGEHSSLESKICPSLHCVKCGLQILCSSCLCAGSVAVTLVLLVRCGCSWLWSVGPAASLVATLQFGGETLRTFVLLEAAGYCWCRLVHSKGDANQYLALAMRRSGLSAGPRGWIGQACARAHFCVAAPQRTAPSRWPKRETGRHHGLRCRRGPCRQPTTQRRAGGAWPVVVINIFSCAGCWPLALVALAEQIGLLP